jgi:hypothetical protein
VFEADAAEGEGEGASDPILLTGPATSVEVHAGDSYTLVIQATGGAAPLHFQWYRQRNAGPLEPIGDDAPELLIESIQSGDAGAYYCVVTDGIDIVVSDTSELVVIEALPMHTIVPIAAMMLVLLAAISVYSTRRTYEHLS